MKPLLLDLFCGAGLAGEGYRRAGFDVVGVDIEPHDYRPGPFVQGDAIAILDHVIANGGRWVGRKVAVVHYSAPCQRWSTATKYAYRHPDYIRPIHARLRALRMLGIVVVGENVPRAPLRRDLLLCGSQFGLAVRRHRVFQVDGATVSQPTCAHRAQGQPVGVYGDHPETKTHFRPSGGSRGVKATSVEHARWAMGVDWDVPWHDVKEGIPPAYTQHIGHQLNNN